MLFSQDNDTLLKVPGKEYLIGINFDYDRITKERIGIFCVITCNKFNQNLIQSFYKRRGEFMIEVELQRVKAFYQSQCKVIFEKLYEEERHSY